MNNFERDSPPPVCRPDKNINVFISDEDIGVFPAGIFDGEMGPLPLLISVNVGYDPEDQDPFMHYYESQEIMFAYKKDAQKRVLMTDSHGRTLSLPLHSTLPFHVCSDNKEMKMAEIVSSRGVPVSVQFARAESLDIIVDGRAAHHSFFGSFTVTAVYEEPYMWCLAVERNGRTGDKPIVLPRNLMSAGFCPVVGIQGVWDPAAKVKEFVAKYSQVASQLDFQGDPFFQEMAFVSRDPAKPVKKVEPYIDNTTFIPIRVARRTPLSVPQREPPPPPPPRTSLHPQQPWTVEDPETSHYSGVSTMTDSNEHIYSHMRDEGVRSESKTNVVKPFQKLSVDLHEGKPPPLPDKTSLRKPLMKPPGDAKAPADVPARPPLPERKSSSDNDSGRVPHNVFGGSMMATPPRALTAQEHLVTLSVEDVAVKLKKLGLEKYAKKFRKNRIDGTILQKLSEEHLKTEFNMTHTEILLLHTFVTEGHIPEMSKSKSAGKSTLR